MPSRSHLFISRDSLTLNVEHTQEISPKSESGDCFSVIPVITVLLLELHHALAWAGPSVGHKYSGRTLEMPCFKKKKKKKCPALQSFPQTKAWHGPSVHSWLFKASPKPWQLVSIFLPGKAAVHWFLPKALPPSTTPRGSKMQVSTLVPLPTPNPTVSFSSQIPANHRHCHQQHERAPKPSMWGACAPFPIKAQKLQASVPFQTNTDSCFCTANEKTQSNKLKPSCEGEVESAPSFSSPVHSSKAWKLPINFITLLPQATVLEWCPVNDWVQRSVLIRRRIWWDLCLKHITEYLMWKINSRVIRLEAEKSEGYCSSDYPKSVAGMEMKQQYGIEKCLENKILQRWWLCECRHCG